MCLGVQKKEQENENLITQFAIGLNDLFAYNVRMEQRQTKSIES